MTIARHTRLAATGALLALASLLSLACGVSELFPSGSWGSPVTDGEHVYAAGGSTGDAVRVDLDGGSLDADWTLGQRGRELGAIYAAPLNTDNVVYIGSYTCAEASCTSRITGLPKSGSGRTADGALNSETPGTLAGPLAWYEPPPGADTGNLILFGTGLRQGDEGRVAALDVDTRREAWSLSTDGDVWGGVAVDDGVGYFGTLGGTLHAINLAPGTAAADRILWSFDAGGPIISRPVVDAENRRIHFGVLSNGQNLFTLNVDTRRRMVSGGVDSLGSGEWSLDAGGWVWAAPLLLRGGDELYFTTLQGEVSAADPADGRLLWSEPADVGQTVLATPLAHPSDDEPERLFVATYRGNVLQIDLGSRRVDQSALVIDNGAGGTPLLVDDRVYVTTIGGELREFDPSSLVQLSCINLNIVADDCG